MIRKYNFPVQNGDETKDEINLFIEIDEEHKTVEIFKEKEASRTQEYIGFVCLTEFKGFLKGFEGAFDE